MWAQDFQGFMVRLPSGARCPPAMERSEGMGQWAFVPAVTPHNLPECMAVGFGSMLLCMGKNNERSEKP